MGRGIPRPREEKQKRVNEKENGRASGQPREKSASVRPGHRLLSSRLIVLSERRIERLGRNASSRSGIAKSVRGEAIGSLGIYFGRSHEDALSISCGEFFPSGHDIPHGEVCTPNAVEILAARSRGKNLLLN